MRAKLSLCLYLLLVELVACALVVVPVYAFQASSSTTGYVRSVNASGASAMFAANRGANIRRLPRRRPRLVAPPSRFAW